MFSRMGAESFAGRARRELLATGETVRSRRDETRGVLTHQESQIARLARDGLSNPQIGAELYISRHTVEWHMRKVFAKLGITSRNQLGGLPLSRLSSAWLDRRSAGSAAHSRSDARRSSKRAMASRCRRDAQLTRATPSAASSASDGVCGNRMTFTGPRTSEVKRRTASVSHSPIGYTQSAPASR